MNNRFRRVMIVWLGLFLLIGMAYAEIPQAPDYWPTEGWRTSTPEAQGMDSVKLAEMLETIQKQRYDLRRMLVIRNGYLVADAVFYPVQPDLWHIIHSCSKSVTSALIGIAIEQGYIKSVTQPVLDFFPDKTVANVDDRKRAMTLEHLLTMSTGFRCQDSYLYNWRGLSELRASQDWVQHALSLPMAEEPGTRFEYCNEASFLLSAIIQQTTGKNALDFAKEQLFAPLGIGEVAWQTNPQGINLGWGGIRIKPHDLAKLGFLYLHKGQWDGKQIIPAEWVDVSTQKHIEANTLSNWYGYQWWHDNLDYVMMMGYAGQYCILLPDKNMVVVFNSVLPGMSFAVPEDLMNRFILPAATSSDPLPENAAGVTRLQAIVNAVAIPPQPEPVPALPKMAQIVSGKTYLLEENTAGFKSIALTFEPQNAEARFKLTLADREINVAVGLDNVLCFNQTTTAIEAYKGAWTSERTFVMDYESIDYAEKGRFRCIFSEDAFILMVGFSEQVNGMSLYVSGQLQE